MTINHRNTTLSPELNLSSFPDYYRELLAYKGRFGNCLVSATESPTEFRDLAIWVNIQRILYRENKLPQQFIDQLNAIGFVWDMEYAVSQAKWNTMFKELEKTQAEYGSCLIPREHRSKYKKLRNWIQTQRREKRKGSLSSERIEQLDSIGFVWNAQETRQESYESQWRAMFKELEKLKEEYGSCLIPREFRSQYKKLYNWIQTQKQEKKKGKLTQERIEQLEAIGFIW